MKIHKTPGRVEMNGHAEGPIQCAMMTALTVSLITNIQRLSGKVPPAHIEDGHFDIDTDKLDDTGRLLFTAYWNSVTDLVRDYPSSFSIV